MKRLLKLLVIVIFYHVLFTSCVDDPEICLQIDPTTCPGINLSNTVLHLTEINYIQAYMSNQGAFSTVQTTEYYIPVEIPKLTENHITAAGYGETTGGENYVEGYEINYGFWSKDSYRKYTWSEMFEWKYGRKPTQQELNALTCEQVKQWFIERHTVKRWIGDDPPRDVKCIVVPIKKYCVTLSNVKNNYTGYLTFPNGNKCKIKNFELKKSEWDGDKNPNVYQIKIEKPCSECN